VVQCSSGHLLDDILTRSDCPVPEHRRDGGSEIYRTALCERDANPRAKTTLVDPKTAPSFSVVSKIYRRGRKGSTRLLLEHFEKLLDRTEAGPPAYPDDADSDKTIPGHLESISRTRSNIPHDSFRSFGIAGAYSIYKDASTDDAAEA
jgi:hypothetical protein